MLALTMILLASVIGAPEQAPQQPIQQTQVIASDLIEEEEEEEVVEKDEIDNEEQK